MRDQGVRRRLAGSLLMPDFSRARERMVEVQIARRGVRDRHVLDAMRKVPREAFVEPGFEEFAYEDGPLPIGEGQTISQPYIVALMIETAEVAPGDRAAKRDRTLFHPSLGKLEVLFSSLRLEV